jgi:hypothetical protein
LLAGEGSGESQFQRLEEKLSTLPTLCFKLLKQNKSLFPEKRVKILEMSTEMYVGQEEEQLPSTGSPIINFRLNNTDYYRIGQRAEGERNSIGAIKTQIILIGDSLTSILSLPQ